MTKFLLHRPIAVFMVTLGLLVFSLLALVQLPVSLLPAIDVPSIVIRVEAPNSSPAVIEENILQPIRENLLTLAGLTGIESTASAGAGRLQLTFSYKAPMDLMYIEVNERIDRLQGQLPPDLVRPQVFRLSTADIPVVRLQVIPREQKDYLAVSELATKVIRRRIEQLPGVSLVEVVGQRETEIAVTPNLARLNALNIPLADLIGAINNSNINWGAISVKDGQYRYYVKVAGKVSSVAGILQLPVAKTGHKIIRVSEVAQVSERLRPAPGYHLLNGHHGLAVIIHKQSNARMLALMAEIQAGVEIFRQEYPQVGFKLTRDQSALLNAGINNLKTALLFGGVFAFSVLFLFMGNVRLALIMGVSLPLSLLLSFLVFYAAGLSINIISLSGLALGLGMLIDNAIIVLDNISAKRLAGHDIITACVLGVKEVRAPLISSVLTTLAVFVPLVYLHGMSGALFYDQAVAVAAILGVSLLVSFSVLPLLYRLLFAHRNTPVRDNKLFARVLALYDRLFSLAWRHKPATLGFITLLCLGGIWLGLKSPRQVLPAIERHDFLLQISWHEPLGLEQNEQRVQEIIANFSAGVEFTESEIGETGYGAGTGAYGRDRAEIYFMLAAEIKLPEFTAALRQWLAAKYPQAGVTISPAPNAFDQLFTSNAPRLKVKLRARDSLLTAAEVTAMLAGTQGEARPGKGFAMETDILLSVDNSKLALYDIDKEALQRQLARIFGPTGITTLKSFGHNTLVSLLAYPGAQENLDKLYITSAKGVTYPLKDFVTVSYGQGYKYLTADAKGIYQAVLYDKVPSAGGFFAGLRDRLVSKGILVDFDGTYFTARKNLRQLGLVLMIAFTLLYFILAAQFESFWQPLIIILTLPLGVGGSLLLIYLSGSSVNIMSAIGVIVMLGIMINDAILKLDTINRLVKAQASGRAGKDLFQPIHEAGKLRLRPILMTSLTTILALLPVMFASGLGADLQRGLVVAVIGGLTVGTFTSMFFVPLAYYYLTRITAKQGQVW